MIKISTIILLALASCFWTRKSDVYLGGWVEKEINFINSIPHIDVKDGYFDLMMYFKWAGIHNGSLFEINDSPFEWIRDPNNLISTHNTIKAIGYKNILSKESYKKTMYFQDRFGGMLKHDWEEKTIEQLVNELVTFYYQENNIDLGYSFEFWQRRIKEKNATQVLSVLEDIQKIYSDSIDANKYTSDNTNDTIRTLIEFDLELQGYNTIPSKSFMSEYFNYLKSIGLNHSAYNWMIERYPNQFSKDSICNILELNIVTESEYWDTRNNGTWIHTYKDNGP